MIRKFAASVRQTSWVYLGGTLFYLLIAAVLFSKFPLRIAGDTLGYQADAAIPITKAEFWQHWRFSTIVFVLKIFGQDYITIARLQLLVSLMVWIGLAGVVALLIQNRRLRLIGFGLVLGLSLTYDQFMWHKGILTESLDDSLIILLLSMFLLLHRRLQNPLPLSRRQQALIGAGFTAVIILWGFSRPPNYMNALILAGTAFVPLVLWWRVARRMWLTCAIIIAALLGVFVMRSTLVTSSNSWQNAYMNNLAADILPYPEKRAFFAERGMPTDEAALHFAGYVPARYAGDWEAVFGDWINARGQRALLEYLLLKPDDQIGELLENWQKLIAPELLTDAYGRRADHWLADWQLKNDFLLFRVSGFSVMVLAGLSLLLGLPWIGRKRPDWRWLVPLVMIFSTLPIIVLNWNADAYEARHYVANSLKIHLGVLLVALFCVDRFLMGTHQDELKPFEIRAQKGAIGLMLLLGIIELFCGYTLTRNEFVYPLVARLVPQHNLLQLWGVSDQEYRLYSYVDLDQPVVTVETHFFDQPYTRYFVLRWGEFGVNGEVWHDVDGLAYAWRTSPQPIAEAGPQGAVYGPAFLPPDQAQALENWQGAMLPHRLTEAGIGWVYVDAFTWLYLPSYQLALLRNPELYREAATWNQSELYQVKGTAGEWAALATGDAESYERYQAYESDLVPARPQVFMPATGALVDRKLTLATLSGIIEVYQDRPAIQERLFDLLTVFLRAKYENELSLTVDQQTALAAWRNSKQADDLSRAGIDYLLFDATWWSYLSAADQATLSDPNQYVLVADWKNILPEFYSLYRLVK